MSISWLFEVNGNYWSTDTITYDGHDYLPKVISDSFDGVTMRCNLDGYLLTPNKIEFEISNPSNAVAKADVEGYDCTVTRLVDTVFSRAWKFKINRAVPYEYKLKCYGVDFLQEFLSGDWPNTLHPKEIWPSDDFDPDSLDDYCVPVVIGTAYIPIMSANTGSDRYYILGSHSINYAGVYASFETSPTIYDGGNATSSFDTGTKWQGSQSLKIVANAADGYVHLSTNSTTYNINIPANKKWVISCYVNLTNANSPLTSNNVDLFVKTSAGTSYSAGVLSVAADGAWHRIQGTLDLSADASTSCILRVDNDSCSGGGDTTMYFDGLQLEIDDGSGVASTFVNPPTYTVTEITSPHDWPGQTLYEDDDYDFNLSDDDGYKLAQFIIADSDGDDTVDANGLWPSGGSGFLPPLVKYSRDDTVSLTSPEEWIEYILEDFGVASGDIDTGVGSSFAAAGVIYAARSQTWNGGFWEKENRESLIVSLLKQCDSTLVVTDKIELHPFDKTSIETITGADIKNLTYSPSPLTQSTNDGGRVCWPDSGKPQDKFPGKSVVPSYTAQASITNPVGDTLVYRFDPTSQNAQDVAVLNFQKRLLQKDRVTFQTECSKITNIDTILPGQVLTLNDALFGASFALVITELGFKTDNSLVVEGIRLEYLEDWDDMSSTEITITGDSSAGWKVAIVDANGVLAEDVNWSGVQDDDDNKPHKQYIIVGPSAVSAEYTTIAAGVAAVTADHAGVYIKNGTYEVDSAIDLPTFDLEIIGESKGGVIIQSPTADFIFERSTTVAKTYKFKNLTFTSRTSANGYHMIYMDAGAYELIIEDCIFNLYDSSATVGDSGVYIVGDNSASIVRILRCTFNGGKWGVRIEDIDICNISACKFDGQSDISVRPIDIENLMISENTFVNLGLFAMWISETTHGISAMISNNQISTSDSLDAQIVGIYIDGYDRLNVLGNIILFNRTGSITTSQIGIIAYQTEIQTSIVGNTIQISSDTDLNVYNIRIYKTSNFIVSDNIIKTDAPDVEGESNGIYVGGNSSNNGIITNNNINLVNNTAIEVGIYIGLNSDDNYGDGNLTYNCGTSIDDNGTGNNITAQDV